MPVIKGFTKVVRLTAEQRASLAAEIQKERTSVSPPAGRVVAERPLVFEIPLESSDRIDLLVIWDRFESISSEDRSAVILDAYKDQAEKVAQALGLTGIEAHEHYVLPYSVRCDFANRASGAAWVAPPPREIADAMIAEGGIPVGEFVRLRLPTRAMAEDALRRLHGRFPNVYWSIGEAIRSD